MDDLLELAGRRWTVNGCTRDHRCRSKDIHQNGCPVLIKALEQTPAHLQPRVLWGV